MAQRKDRLIWWVLAVSVIITVGLWLFPIVMVRSGEHLNYEMTAIRSLKLLHSAQMQHLNRHRSYAGSLQELGGLIPEDLARGTRFGYQFHTTAEPTNYRLYATPIKFGETGRRSFYSDASQIIRENWGAEPAGPQSKEIR